MRRRKHKESSEIHLGFQIAPMIDVVFVIMLFFMVMATKVKIEMRHNTQLPGTVELKEGIITPDEIAIRIEDDGQVYLNDDPLDTPEAKNLPELAGNLIQLKKSAVASKSDLLVTIYGAEQAKYERFVDCLDALTRAGIEKVTFQAGAPE